MKTTHISPTPYPDVNALLEQLLKEVQAILKDRFVGLYLHGSLAYGDFDPRTSDIDFLVVTQGSLPEEAFAALKEMHARLRAGDHPWAQKMEGAYLPKDALRRHNPHGVLIPWLGVDGHFAWEGLGYDWIIQRWILREKGLAVVGPRLKPLIDPVGADEIRQAVRVNLCDWWTPPLPSPKRFESGEYQAYAILTMCRSLYVLEFGRIASKPEAARWALKTLDEPWNGLVNAAAAWRPGTDFNRLDETLEFIRFTLEKWGLPGDSETGKTA